MNQTVDNDGMWIVRIKHQDSTIEIQEVETKEEALTVANRALFEDDAVAVTIQEKQDGDKEA
jgi:hypothetical protein